MATIDDFAALDIRDGTIKEAEFLKKQRSRRSSLRLILDRKSG